MLLKGHFDPAAHDARNSKGISSLPSSYKLPRYFSIAVIIGGRCCVKRAGGVAPAIISSIPNLRIRRKAIIAAETGGEGSDNQSRRRHCVAVNQLFYAAIHLSLAEASCMYPLASMHNSRIVMAAFSHMYNVYALQYAGVVFAPVIDLYSAHGETQSALEAVSRDEAASSSHAKT